MGHWLGFCCGKVLTELSGKCPEDAYKQRQVSQSAPTSPTFSDCNRNDGCFLSPSHAMSPTGNWLSERGPFPPSNRVSLELNCGQVYEEDTQYKGHACMFSLLTDDLIALVFGKLTTAADRNAASLVCRRWYRVEGETRESVRIPHCTAIDPCRVVERFPSMKSFTIQLPTWNMSVLGLNTGSPSCDRVFLSDDSSARPWIKMISLYYPRLEEISLCRVRLTNSDLELLGDACGATLRTVRLRECDNLTDAAIASLIIRCSCLEVLDLGQSEIRAVGLTRSGRDHTAVSIEDVVHKCSALKGLNLDMHDVRENAEGIDTIFSGLVSQLPSGLESLQLGHLDVPRVTLPKSLKRLVVCGFEEGGCIDNLAHLEGMGMMPCAIGHTASDRRLPPSVLKRLRFLDVTGWSSANVDDEFFQFLQGKSGESKLEGLAFSRIGVIRLWGEDERLIYPEDVLKTVVTGHAIRRLAITSFEGDGNKAMQVIADNCPGLGTLKLGYATISGLEGFQAAGKKLRCLTGLTLAWTKWRVDQKSTQVLCLDDGLGEIWRGCQLLESIELSLSPGCLTDYGIALLATSCRNLWSLRLRECGESSASLAHIAVACTNLRRLMIDSCPFSNSGLRKLAKGCPHLRSLEMSHMKQSLVTEKGVQAFAKLRPFWIVETTYNSFTWTHQKVITGRHVSAFASLCPPQSYKGGDEDLKVFYYPKRHK
eukprot:TRINITY_DN8977_c0_g1_i2.p1 TRINITY_DN8977_c0_g1~~TRINITY_DN8977_c0_g1_i2.p1  ORF type:complete len:708 (+),score=103.38 TRINITY_DN8977_c0_g1_i2:277-2400(+)